MGRFVRRTCIGTPENFEKVIESTGFHKIDADGVYWGDNGDLYIVSNSEWTSYLTGTTDQIPTTGDIISDADFECSEDSLRELLFGGVVDA